MSGMLQRPPSVLACMVTLAVVDLHAKLRGLRRTLQLVSGARATTDSLSPDLVAETARRVSVAAAFYPRRALCLEQSLALYVLLRRRGVNAQLRLGVQPRPFFAHAWVEVDGVPVAEHGGLPLQMTAFPLLGV
jgi:hypothetical protein